MRTRADCPVEIDIDTFYAYDRTTGARLQREAYAAALKHCGAVGATIEGNAGAREKAARAAVAFLQRALAN